MKTYNFDDVILDGSEEIHWVPAEVVHGLYDALKEIVESGDWYKSALEIDTMVPNCKFGDELHAMAISALAAADGEEA